MDRIKNASIALALLAFIPGTQTIAAVGHTPGSANVSDTGEASYTIPILTPRGTNGMTPNLALVYGHRSGSTLLGAGWGISGLSAITRCPRNFAADGESREPRNDYSDRFCLDGNKLRWTSGGFFYGGAGTTYQTEIETFARITANGAVGNGPASFTVVDRNGVTYEYGATADSFIESVGQTTARVWALNKIRDQSDNRITFTYAEDTVNGAYRIDRIQYTTNPTQGISIAPYEVDFVWQAKPAGEVDSGYMAGSLIKEVNRLDRIDVNSGTTLVRRYELTYEGSLSSTMKSRLASIQECAGSPLDCLSPTTFVYQNGSAGFGSEVNTAVAVPTTPWPIDVNGDGRDDLVYSSSVTSGSGTWKVMFANSSGGYNAPIDTGVTNTNYSGATPIDYNADGFGDLLVPYSGGTWWAMLGSATGLAAPFNTSAPATSTGINARAMDVNGDGRDDLVWAEYVGYAGGDTIRYRLRTPAGPTGFSSTISNLVAPYPADHKIEVGVFGPGGQPMARRIPDFNGDGRDDVVYRHTQRVWIDGTSPPQYTFTRTLEVVCAGGFSFSASALNAAGELYYGDFNGDGKSDLFYLNNTGNLVARFSTGAGFTIMNTVASGSTYSQYAILDWDHDGKDDILLTNASGTVFVVRSTGEGFAAPASLGFTPVGSTVADINGDGLHDLAYAVSGTWRFRLHTLTEADLLQTVTDGFGNYSTFSYAPLATYSLYSKQTGAVFPLQDYSGPLQVVTNVTSSNGIGGSYSLQNFYYQGARLNLQGHPFPGFEYRSWIDSRDGTAQRRSYRQDFPYIGAVTNAKRTQEPSGTVITEVQTTYATYAYSSGYESRALPYVSQTTRTDREVTPGTFNGALLRTVVQTNAVDSTTGVNYDTTITTTEPASGANGLQPGASYVQRIYQPVANLTTTAACLGKPQHIEQTNSNNLPFGGASITRTTDLTWDTTKCRVTQQVSESGDALLQVTRNLDYDAFGNLSSDAVIGIGMPERKTTFDWITGGTGQFPLKVARVVSPTVSETTDLGWDAAKGLLTSVKDPNRPQTTTTYDAFGRPTREDRPDTTATTWDYTACTAPSYCGYPVLRYYVQTTLRDTSNVAVRTDHQYFDTFDRLKFDEPLLVTGARVQTAIDYDAFGRVAQQSAPRFTAGTLFYTTFTYDLLDRVTQASRPTSDSDSTPQTETISYKGLTTVSADALSKQTTTVSNVVGAMVQSTDHDGYYQSFDYDSFGNVLRVQDSLSNTLQTITYNKRGMRTGLTDLDTGARTFTPNALGEIVSELDAKSQTRTFGFDTLGRLTSRHDIEGDSTFTFGTLSANHNVGRLVTMSGPGPGYSESYTYDSIGRLSQRQITSDATYLINFSYNSIGALDTLQYPTSTSGYRLKLQYDYAKGELLRVKDFAAPATVFWQANSADPWGNITDETLGNGAQTVRGFDLATGVLDSIFSQRSGIGTLQDLSYKWNAVGSVTERKDNLQLRTENFNYDNLHRLTSTTGADPMAIVYDVMGNITSKTGIGTYTYHASRKHQATATSGGTLPAQSYAYDANGNMNSRNGSSISWYSYDLPNTINASGSNSSQFFYAPDRSRWKQVASYGGTSEQTIYIGGLIEKVTLGTVTSWKHYIAGGNGSAAVYIRRSTGTNETDYMLKDHLGSTDVILNSSGAVMSRLSFDPWGRRRDGATWTGNPAPGEWTTITSTTRRGFTFHEALDNLGLVHMNGRVYDPVVARFLSADPIVQAPSFSQSFNRYSYTFNNPLSFVDPSGYSPADKAPRRPINPNEPYDPNTIRGNFGGLAGGGGNMALPWPDVWSQRRDWSPDATPGHVGTIAGPGSTVSTVGGNRFTSGDLYGPYISELGPSNHQACAKMDACGNAGPVPPKDAFLQGAMLGGIVGFPILLSDPLIATLFGLAGTPQAASDGFPIAGAIPSRLALIDSSAVVELGKDATLGGRLLAGEEGVVSYVTQPELRNAVARGSLRGVPGALNRVDVLCRRPPIDAIINFRGGLVRSRGRFGDGIIGAQSVEFGIPLITNDVELANAVRAAGGTVR
jgi:RHS repeat-associated protein